jgi:flagellar hook-associated protein 1
MSIFSVGLSGLSAAQTALHTTSNNISNVYTPGYNRELTLLGETRTGSGVRVNDVQRQFDQYVAGQLNAANSAFQALRSYQTQVSQIDNLLADDKAGLAPLMQNFFSSLEDLAGSPSDPAARQGVIGAADTLTAQFRAFDDYLQDMQVGVDGQIRDEIAQVNTDAEQLAVLNREIALAKARHGEAPNSLLNQRDQLVAQLSERINVKLTVQDSGTYNLTIGNGQPLVAGSNSFSLEAMTSPEDPTRTVVGYRDSAGNLSALDPRNINGGSLGGLISFRDETLDQTRNQIGQLAVTLAVAFNTQHAQGVDMEGNPGEAFFAIGAPRVYGNSQNTGSASLSGVFGDLDALTASDYDLRVSDAAAGEFTVTRRDTGESFTATLNGAGELEFGGVVLTVDDPAALADGDRFLLQPVRAAAGDMETLIRETGAIAAGLSGDSGDNENALALQNLQEKALVGGAATFSQAYATLVGDVGSRTNIVQDNLAAQQGLTEQLSAVQQSESGVNLDEEAANLIRYQQYYQANARVIEAGVAVIDTLLGLRA